MKKDYTTTVSIIMALGFLNTILLVFNSVLIAKLVMQNNSVTTVASTPAETSTVEDAKDDTDTTDETTDDEEDSLTAADIQRETVQAANDEPTDENLTLTCTDGKTVKYSLPDNMYVLNTNYKDLLKQSMQMESDPNTSVIVVGDTDNVTTSNYTINATTLNNIGVLYEQMYSDYSLEDDPDSVKSAAYIYHTTGKVPEDAPLNYEIKKLESYTGTDGIKYTSYLVDYDTDYNEGVPSENQIENSIMHTKCITTYGDTDDVIEIIAFSKDDDVLQSTVLEKLKAFVGAE